MCSRGVGYWLGTYVVLLQPSLLLWFQVTINHSVMTEMQCVNIYIKKSTTDRYVQWTGGCWSTLKSYVASGFSSQAITSGAIQYGVPINVFLLPTVLSNWAETPKSTAGQVHKHTNKILQDIVCSLLSACLFGCVCADAQRYQWASIP